MATAQVHRPVRTWKGDIQGELNDYLIGTVTGVVMGGPSVQPLARFPGTVSTEGQVGIPFAQESGVVVQQHDRLLIDSTLYAVVSDHLWTQANTLTGTEPTHYWVAVASTS
ncbi:MAG: 32, Wildcat 32 [Mycobacterium sp.]|nr:32, Wildcat 32 [Mycobacterium sp.]